MSNESPSHAPKPAPAFEPHMVMARRHVTDKDTLVFSVHGGPEIGFVIPHAKPILTVPLEEAARAVQLAYYRSEYTTDREELWREVALAVCALKVREARDVAEPRALPDREDLAHTIFGIMTDGGTWSSDSGRVEMRSFRAADRALELCGAATGDDALADARRTISKLTLERDALTSSLRNSQARADKAESKKRSAEARAEERWKERTKLRGEVNELRGQLETAQNLEREARFHRERAESDLKAARELIKRPEEGDAPDAITKLRARAEKAEAERDFEKKIKERFIAARDAEWERAEEAEKERDSLRAQLILAESNSKALLERAEKAEADLDLERKRLAACGAAAIGGYHSEWREAYKSAAMNDVLSLRTQRDTLTKVLADARAELAKAEAELAALKQPSDLTDSDLARLSTGPLVGWKELRAVANAAAAKARAQAQPAAAVPAKPTLKELKASEWEALLAVNRAVQHMSATAPEDENAFARARAILIYRQAEYGRAVIAVDAHKKENQ